MIHWKPCSYIPHFLNESKRFWLSFTSGWWMAEEEDDSRRMLFLCLATEIKKISIILKFSSKILKFLSII